MPLVISVNQYERVLLAVIEVSVGRASKGGGLQLILYGPKGVRVRIKGKEGGPFADRPAPAAPSEPGEAA